MDIIFVLSIVLLLVLIVAVVGLRSSIQKVLQSKHKNLYSELLMSETYDENEIVKQKLLAEFLKSKRFEQLKDTELTSLCRRYILLGKFFVVMVIIFFVNLVVMFGFPKLGTL
jgi:hypothetical protein